MRWASTPYMHGRRGVSLSLAPLTYEACDVQPAPLLARGELGDPVRRALNVLYPTPLAAIVGGSFTPKDGDGFRSLSSRQPSFCGPDRRLLGGDDHVIAGCTCADADCHPP